MTQTFTRAIDMRSGFTLLYRYARRHPGVGGPDLSRQAHRLMGDDHQAATMIGIAVDRALLPAETRRDTQRALLNCWTRGLDPFLCPPMSSPRFKDWRRRTRRVDALAVRLLARGLIARGPGGFTGLTSLRS